MIGRENSSITPTRQSCYTRRKYTLRKHLCVLGGKRQTYGCEELGENCQFLTFMGSIAFQLKVKKKNQTANEIAKLSSSKLETI